MSDILFVRESELPRRLETRSRKNKDSDPKFAQVTMLPDGSYVTFRERLRKVIDVLSWSISESSAVASAEFSEKFFKLGYPAGRKPVIVILGE